MGTAEGAGERGRAGREGSAGCKAGAEAGRPGTKGEVQAEPAY